MAKEKVHALGLLSKDAYYASSRERKSRRQPLPVSRYENRSKELQRILVGGGDLYLAIISHAAFARASAVRA